MTAPNEPPRIVVLMATWNGAENLLAQLESLAVQSLPPVQVIISDDGSRDATTEIVARFAQAHQGLGVELRAGPCKGAAQNFLGLIRAIPDSADYVALSDQDDVWLPEKLAVAVARLQEAGAGPALYCGRTWECDEDLSNRRLSRGAQKPAGFRHALVQNIAGGNTMVLDRAAARALREAAKVTPDVVVHDWWAYQIICAIGGRVIFDDTPRMLYRQHAQNLIGANRGPRAMMTRLGMLLSGRFRAWGDTNITALRCIAAQITPENRALLDQFANGRQGPAWARLAMLRRCGLYRQGLAGQISLYVAALLKRL